MSLSGRSRRWLVVGGVVCAALVTGAVAYVVVDRVRGGDDGSDEIGAADVLSDDQLELIHRAVPDPGCSSEPTPAPDDESLVPLDVVRVEGTCLDASTEYVPADRVDERRAELDRDPSVVATAVVPLASPDQVDDRRDDQWALDALGVPEGSTELPWPDGDGVVVAVVDTGVEAAHDDLTDAVVARRSYPGESELDPYEGGHGTQVAGIIAARRDHGGIVGVAPASRVLDVPVRLEGAEQNPDSPYVGLAWAVNHGADVANLSFGALLADEDADSLVVEQAAVAFALDNDVVVVTGAGNCGNHGPYEKCPLADEPQTPAVFAGVVAVGAVQDDFHLAGYSTRNEHVDLVAPGGRARHKILTTAPGGEYEGFDGTSAAAPHVAAGAAVMRSAVPEATAGQVRGSLIESADPDRIPDGDRSDPGAGRGFLDIVAAVEDLRAEPSPPPGDLADRTQAAFVQDGMLYAFDGTTSHPVRRIDEAAPVAWLEWSADHTQLAGLAGSTLFAWAGPDSQLVEVPYEINCPSWCTPSLAYLDDVTATDPGAGETGDLVVSVRPDGTLVEYQADTLQQLGAGTAALTFPQGPTGAYTLQGHVGGQLLVEGSGGTYGQETIWLVDPVSREARVSREVAGGVVQAPVAVDAAGDRVALIASYGQCSQHGHPPVPGDGRGIEDQVYVLDGGDLTELARPATPSGLVVDDLFFNGDALYATMMGIEETSGPGRPCTYAAAGSLWRLDGDTWQQVDSTPRAAARPLEGRTGDFPEGWLVVSQSGQGSLGPPQEGDPTHGDLGQLADKIWSTPTRSEVSLTSMGSGAPSDGTGEPEERTPREGSGAPPTVEAAIARFEEFLHALGAGDVATSCAIGRVAVEAQGGGLTCEEAIPILVEASPDAELAALREATVNPSQATQTAPDRVEIAPAYPYSTEPETDPPVVMEHDGTNWFLVQ